MRTAPTAIIGLFVWTAASGLPAADPPAPAEVSSALRRATEFFHGRVARQGGYVYAYSSDLSLSEGEGTTDEQTIWVQPPGTPAVGEAFLDAYAATGDRIHLDAARDAGWALVLGQLQSGGWFYSIRFNPELRKKLDYRFDLEGNQRQERVSPKDRAAAAGWNDWKRRKYEGNLTILDDDVTQAATRFLIRLDRVTGSGDETIHEAALLALTSLLGAQYPNGAWSASYDRLPQLQPSAEDYPVTKASYPDRWSPTWPKDFPGCYVTNDDLIADAIDTMLFAWQEYDDKRYLASAKRAGDFLLRAQMPPPQPAWAQQYDSQMQPCWSRAFEPPAVSGLESQNIIAALMRLAEATGEETYLEPIPAALDYLESSLRPDGRLARFYELKTNRPIYFTRRNGRHELTYDDNRLATGYGYIVDSRLDELRREYERVKSHRPASDQPTPARLSAEARRVLDAQDARGAWIEQGRLRHHKVEPEGGVINSSIFAANMTLLSQYLNTD